MNRFSIMQKEKKCVVCEIPFYIHIHEVYYGTANRKKSIEDGCCVYLCGKHHNQSKEGVHFNRELDLKLKKEMQIAWMMHYNKTIDDFIKRYHRNYL